MRSAVAEVMSEFLNFVSVEMNMYIRTALPRGGGRHKFDTQLIVLVGPDGSFLQKVCRPMLLPVST